MDNETHPYRPPGEDRIADLKAKLRRRKLINYALAFGLTVVLLCAWFGIRLLMWVFNEWYFARP